MKTGQPRRRRRRTGLIFFLPMRELRYGIDRKKGILSFILGILVSVGMNLSLTRVATEANSPDLDLADEKLLFIRNLYLSFSGSRMKLFLIAVVMMLLIYYALTFEPKLSENILIVIYSACFALCQLIGIAMRHDGTLVTLLDAPIYRIRALCKGISYGIVCAVVVKDLLHLVRTQFIQRVAVEHTLPRKKFLLDMLLILAAWLPYYWIFFPGTSNEDTVIQIMEYFHIPSYINRMTPVTGPDVYITNHHPYLLTLLFGRFIKIGLSLGSASYGVALYVILHMLFLSAVFSIGLWYLRRIGVTEARVRTVLLIVMFFPLFPLYAVCMVKDTIYAAFCLLYILMMNEIARTKGKAFEKWYFCVLLFLDGLAMALTKVYGMYILIVVGIIYLIAYSRYLKQIALSIALPLFLFAWGFLHLLLPALNVAPGGVQEALSVPFQQTARYVTYCGDEVTEEERKAINEVLPYAHLADRYNPKLSDPVKKYYRQSATDKELRAYFKVWFQMFRKHPRVYLEATLNNTYEYFYIEKTSSLEYYQFNTYLQDHDESGKYQELYVINDEKKAPLRYAVTQLMLTLEKIPIVNVFASIGLLPWILFFFVLLNLFRRKKGYTIALLIPLLTLGVCLVSADNGNFRYIMPVMFSLPYLTVLVLMPERDGERITENGM